MQSGKNGRREIDEMGRVSAGLDLGKKVGRMMEKLVSQRRGRERRREGRIGFGGES